MKLPSIRFGAASLAAGSAIFLAGRLLRRRVARPALPAPVAADPAAASVPSAGHIPNDLAADRSPGLGERAVDAFRPDPTAPIPAEEREALRPAPPLQSAADALAQSDRAEAVQ
jgi:hypothetical protein